MTKETTATKSTHTTKPWYVGAQNDMLYIIAGRAPSPDNDYPMHEAARTVIAKVYDEDKSHTEAEANARLIAAAPELYVSVRELREACAAMLRVIAGIDAMARLGMAAETHEQRVVDELEVSGVIKGFGVRADDLLKRIDGE